MKSKYKDFIKVIKKNKFYENFIDSITEEKDYCLIQTNLYQPVPNDHFYAFNSRKQLNLLLYVENDHFYLSDDGVILETASVNANPGEEKIAKLIFKYGFNFQNGKLTLEVNDSNFTLMVSRFARFIHRYYLDAGLGSTFMLVMDEDVKNHIKKFYCTNNRIFKYPFDEFDEIETTLTLPTNKIQNRYVGEFNQYNDSFDINVYVKYKNDCEWYDLIATYEDGRRVVIPFSGATLPDCGESDIYTSETEQLYFGINTLGLKEIRLASSRSNVMNFVVDDAFHSINIHQYKEDKKDMDYYLKTPGVYRVSILPGVDKSIEIDEVHVAGANILFQNFNKNNFVIQKEEDEINVSVLTISKKKAIYIHYPFTVEKVGGLHPNEEANVKIKEVFSNNILRGINLLDEDGNYISASIFITDTDEKNYEIENSRTYTFFLSDSDLHVHLDYQDAGDNLCRVEFDTSSLIAADLFDTYDSYAVEVGAREEYKNKKKPLYHFAENTYRYFVKGDELFFRISSCEEVKNLIIKEVYDDEVKEYKPTKCSYVVEDETDFTDEYVTYFYTFTNIIVKGPTRYYIELKK